MFNLYSVEGLPCAEPAVACRLGQPDDSSARQLYLRARHRETHAPATTGVTWPSRIEGGEASPVGLRQHEPGRSPGHTPPKPSLSRGHRPSAKRRPVQGSELEGRRIRRRPRPAVAVQASAGPRRLLARSGSCHVRCLSYRMRRRVLAAPSGRLARRAIRMKNAA